MTKETKQIIKLLKRLQEEQGIKLPRKTFKQIIKEHLQMFIEKDEKNK